MIKYVKYNIVLKVIILLQIRTQIVPGFTREILPPAKNMVFDIIKKVVRF